MSPFHILFLVFLIVPIVEIYVLIQVGGIIGAIPTIFLVVFTAVLGALLLRVQGFATLRRVQESMARGEIPAIAMLEGVALIVAGALLLTPGFFTDAVGFFLLVPAMRRWIIRRVLRNAVVIGPGGGQPESESEPEAEPTYRRPPPSGSARKGGRVIEGEYERKD